MRTLPKIVLTAMTLTASFGIVGVGTVRAEAGQSLDRAAFHKIPSDVVQAVGSAASVDGGFNPEPNNPPIVTGGTGTR